MMSPEAVKAWLELGVPGLLLAGLLLFYWLFRTERTDHQRTAREAREDAVRFAEAITALRILLERAR